MRKMHKILSVAMATAMTMSLVACGGSADNDADVTDKEEVLRRQVLRRQVLKKLVLKRQALLKKLQI